MNYLKKIIDWVCKPYEPEFRPKRVYKIKGKTYYLRKRITKPAKFKNERSWIWAIRMSIAKKIQGRTQKTRAYPFINKSFTAAEPFITQILTQAGLKDITLELNNAFEQSAS